MRDLLLIARSSAITFFPHVRGLPELFLRRAPEDKASEILHRFSAPAYRHEMSKRFDTWRDIHRPPHCGIRATTNMAMHLSAS